MPALSRVRQFLSIYFSVHGNETKYWKQAFDEAVEDAVKKYTPRAVFTTVPPFSVLPLVTTIAHKYKLPLVLDFRDAWSQWRTIPYGTIFHYWKTLQMEGKYLQNADAIIATSQNRPWEILKNCTRPFRIISYFIFQMVTMAFCGSGSRSSKTNRNL